MSSYTRPSESFDIHPKDEFATSRLAQKRFDAIAIGSGWTSRVALGRLSAKGLSTLLIEDELIGGDCPFWACVPSKVLLRPQEALDAAAGISGAKEGLKDDLDVKAIFERRDIFTGNHSDSPILIPMLQALGVTIVRGTGSLIGEKRVQIVPSGGGDPIIVEANRAVIVGTGSRPLYPKVIKGLEEAKVWEPRDATSSSTVPEHLIILGAGAVGTEMAFAYHSFGAKITLVSHSDEILPLIDCEASKIVREHLVGLGATVKVGSSAVEVIRHDGSVEVTLMSGETITGSEVLLAAGRSPRTAELNLQSIGVKPDKKGFLPVDAHLRVQNTTWLYAGGDVIGHGQLTHVAKYHGRIISNCVMGDSTFGSEWSSTHATADTCATPQVVFSHPPIASVGLTKKAAAAKGISVREITAPFASLGGRIASDKTPDGWAQWLVDDERRLVGATFVGNGADEQLHASTVAIVGGLTLDRLVHAVPSFPTLSEVYLGLIDAAGL